VFEMISIVVVTLRQPRAIETSASIARRLPRSPSATTRWPLGWSQNWWHLSYERRTSVENRYVQALPSVLWGNDASRPDLEGWYILLV
jgi:hypothetical protein